MDIVTVTWYNDLRWLVLQAASLNRFVSGSVRHYIVISDRTVSLSKWRRLLEPYYTQHELCIVRAPEEFLVRGSSYLNQQALKYWAGTLVNAPYLITDSKHLWIKPVSLTDYVCWPHSDGAWTTDSEYSTGHLSYRPWVLYISSKLGIEPRTRVPSLSTPYVFDPQIVERLGGFLAAARWLRDAYLVGGVRDVSEFLLYGHLIPIEDIDQLQDRNTVHYTVWPTEPLHPRIVLNKIHRPHVKSTAFHWRWLQKNPENATIANEYIAMLGLPPILKARHLDRWV